MVSKMDEEGFGHCTNTGACEAECPKEISLQYIRKMNLEYNLSILKDNPLFKKRGPTLV